MNPAIALMKEAGTVNILSDRVTMEYVLEKLSKGFPQFYPSTGPPQQQTLKLALESAALLVSTELSVFITASQFSITCLSDLWDTKEGVFQYGTRGRGEWNINSPCISLLGGSAQEWLTKSIPGDAVGGGFTRRVNFVLATKKDKKVPWPSNGQNAVPLLADDLRQISLLRGEFSFSRAARRLFEDYYNGCEPDEFDDEATAVYKTSKWANATKLAQCLSASRGDSLEISEQDFLTAMEKVEEVTADLKIVFRATGESGLASQTDKVVRFMEKKGYVSRNEILQANWRHIVANELDVIIATLREANLLLERTVGNKTLYAWKDSTLQPNP
jgi:hypothetical protein